MKAADIKDKIVKFKYYRDGELWYEIVGLAAFQFPVPLSDTGTAVFKYEDKAIYFMRWIRKHKEMIEREKDNTKTV